MNEDGIIKELPETVINEIAAGEMISTPASVVKELVENSIDSGATEIEIYVEKGGKSLVRVLDNGHGISKVDLPKSIQCHTTSKFKDDDGLSLIKTHGFRGEALYSIASASKIKIESAINNDHGWSIELENSGYDRLKPIAMMRGTRVTVADLFFQMPVRAKFLAREALELGRIQEKIKEFALLRPEISFIVKSKGSIFSRYEACKTESDYRHRISALFTSEFADKLLPFQVNKTQYSLRGYIAPAFFTRRYRDFQKTFVNSRVVNSKLIKQAAQLAYHDLIDRNRFPCFLLFLELPGNQLDINVHPTKSEVKFQNESEIRNFIYTSLREQLARSNLHAQNEETESVRNTEKKALNLYDSGFTRRIQDLPSKKLSIEDSLSEKPSTKALRSDNYKLSQQNLSLEILENQRAGISIETDQFKENSPTKDLATLENHKRSIESLGYPLALLHGRYILTENKNGMAIIDAHAAHERILYEKIKKEFRKKNLIGQELLQPIRVNLTKEEGEALSNNQEKLEKLQIIISQGGENLFLIRRVPALLIGENLEELIRDLAGFLTNRTIDPEPISEEIEEIYRLLSCHNAWRQPYSLSLQEMTELIRQIEKTPFSEQCNHGRPTWHAISLKEIDQIFRRI